MRVLSRLVRNILSGLQKNADVWLQHVDLEGRQVILHWDSTVITPVTQPQVFLRWNGASALSTERMMRGLIVPARPEYQNGILMPLQAGEFYDRDNNPDMLAFDIPPLALTAPNTAAIWNVVVPGPQSGIRTSRGGWVQPYVCALTVTDN